MSERVHFYGRLDDPQAGYVILKAIALVFPSFYEGFGLPPLEAALLGTPSICSTRPAMTEFLDGAALFADPESPEEWADAIKRMYGDAKLRDKLRCKARYKAEELTWAKSALMHVDILRRTANKELKKTMCNM